MHELQPGNRIGYGLAWMQQYVRGFWTSGHGGDLPGVDTWMLYNQTEDIGVIYLANGNAEYSNLPLRGQLIVILILYLLFTNKERSEGRHNMKSPYHPISLS
jgi:hypothetical protein